MKFFNSKLGQFQFSFVESKDNSEYNIKKFVFVEAAKILSDGKRCDWNNKVKFKLGDTDIGNILLGMRKKEKTVDLIHRYNDKVSSLKIKEGTNNSISLTIQNEQNSVFIYLNEVDQFRLYTFLDESIRRIYV